MSNYNTLGERIKKVRKKSGKSQKQLAEELNCTQAALSQYEKGVREPGLSDLVNLANKLNTSVDYLLGRTEVLSEDFSIRNIGDYLGLDEKTIALLHEMYINRKNRTAEEYLLKDVEVSTGAIPGDANFITDYNYTKQYYQQDLDDYTKTLNQLLCSYEFAVLILNLTSNLYLERRVYDLLRIAVKQYDKMQSCIKEDDFVEYVYGLVEDSEDDIKQYMLNLFEIQNAITDFSKEFTKLETVKKAEHRDFLYRKVILGIYCATHPMFESKQYSIDKMEEDLEYVRVQYGEEIESLLRCF